MIQGMSVPDAAALSALLAPSTLMRRGPLARFEPWANARIKAPAKDARADLALVAGSGADLAVAARQAAARSRAVLCLSTAGGSVPAVEGVLVLGPGSGIWTPRVRAGLAGAGYKASGGEPWLALVQDRLVAERLLQHAKENQLPLQGVVATGEDRPTSWLELALAAREMTPVPPLLVALHRQQSASSLTCLADHPSPVVLLLTGEARVNLTWPDFPGGEAPTGEALCRGLGLPLVRTPAAMVAVAVRQPGTGPTGSPRVLLRARSDGEEALLRDTWAAAEPPAGARLTVTDQEPPPPGSDRAPHLVLDAQSDQASPHSLAAFCALARAAAAAPSLGRRPKIASAGALELLDSWPAVLDELRTKELVACYGLDAPAEEIASSASAAQRIAQSVGLPVAVKPVGPTLRGRQELGALALNLTTSASVRQAFADVLLPLSDQEPPVFLEGVMVSAMVPLPGTLECTLLWPEAGPPLVLLRVSRPGDHCGDPRVEAMPIRPGRARQVSSWLAAQGFWGPEGSASAEETRSMADTLERLSWMGPDLAGRLRWLRLDTVSPPLDQGPARVIDGCGEQTGNS